MTLRTLYQTAWAATWRRDDPTEQQMLVTPTVMALIQNGKRFIAFRSMEENHSGGARARSDDWRFMRIEWSRRKHIR